MQEWLLSAKVKVDTLEALRNEHDAGETTAEFTRKTMDS